MKTIAFLDSDNWIDGVCLFDMDELPPDIKQKNYVELTPEEYKEVNMGTEIFWHDGTKLVKLADKKKIWRHLHSIGLQGRRLTNRTEELVPTIDSPSLFSIAPNNIKIKDAKPIHRWVDPIFEAEIQLGLVYRTSTLDDAQVWADAFINNTGDKAWIVAANLIADPAVWPIVTTWRGKIIQVESYQFRADRKTVIGRFASHIDRKRPHWFWTKMAKKLFESLHTLGVEKMIFAIRKEYPEYMDFLKETYGATPIYTKEDSEGIFMTYNIDHALEVTPDWPERKSLPGWSFNQDNIEVREGSEEDLPQVREVMQRQWGKNPRRRLALRNLDEWWNLDRATLLLGYYNKKLEIASLVRHRKEDLCLKMIANPMDEVEPKALNLLREVFYQWMKDAGYKFTSCFLEKTLYNRTAKQFWPNYTLIKEHPDKFLVSVVELLLDLKDRGIR